MGTEINKSDIFVLVPSYNHGRYIEGCLRSIFAQTLKPSKLLVIDDGSKDDSPSRIEQTLKDCPFDSELVARPNRGLCATLNEGLERSSGEYFAYIGSDDMWLPRFLDARRTILEARRDSVLAYGHAFLIDENDEIVDSSANHTRDWAFFPDGDPMPMLMFGTSPVSSTVMYRRQSLEGMTWNENARLEDYEMYLKLSKEGAFAFDPQILSAWRRHHANTSRDINMMMDEILGAQQRMFEAGVLTAAELELATGRTKFRFVRDLLQAGRKAEALALAKDNFNGARSVSEQIAFGLRMATPMGIVNLRRVIRSKRRRQKIQEYLWT